MAPTPSSQRGVSLLESLIAILIFSVGILAIVALQTTSIRTGNDAKFRADASYLANQLVARMWADRSNLAAYAHNTAGAFTCDAKLGTTVAAPAKAELNAWLQNVNAILPQASNGGQRVTVDTATGLVTITMCWRAGTDARDTRQFVVSTQISG